MEQITDGIQFVILAAACRFVVHFVAQFWDAVTMPNSSKARRKALLVLTNAIVPVAASLSSDLHLVNGSTTWAVLEGLAAAAVIAGVHGAGKQWRRGLTATTNAREEVFRREVAAADRYAASPYGDARGGAPWGPNVAGPDPEMYYDSTERYDVDPAPDPDQEEPTDEPR